MRRFPTDPPPLVECPHTYPYSLHYRSSSHRDVQERLVVPAMGGKGEMGLRAGRVVIARTRPRRGKAFPAQMLGTAQPSSDDEAAQYMRSRYADLLKDALHRGDNGLCDGVRVEVEAEMQRLRQSADVVGGRTLQVCLQFVLAAKGAKRSLQLFRKWQSLGHTLDTHCYTTMLAALRGPQHSAFMKECFAAGCPEDRLLLHARLSGVQGKGLDRAAAVVARMRALDIAPDDATLALALRAARNSGEADKLLDLLGVTSSHVLGDPGLVVALAASSSTHAICNRLRLRWWQISGKARGGVPAVRAWCELLAKALLREGGHRGWKAGTWAEVVNLWETVSVLDSPPTTQTHIVLMSCALDVLVARVGGGGQKPPDGAIDDAEVLRLAEAVFKAARRTADARLWEVMFKVYGAAGKPKEALRVGFRTKEKTGRLKVRPTKAMLAAYLQSIKPIKPRPAFVPLGKEPHRTPRHRKQEVSALPPRSAKGKAPKGFLPWVPGERPDPDVAYRVAFPSN